MDRLSKTFDIEATDDVVAIVAGFDPVVKRLCYRLQSCGRAARYLKVGVYDSAAGWQWVGYPVVVWRYDDLIKQVELSVGIGIDWGFVSALHLTVSELVDANSIDCLGSPDVLR